MFWGQKCQKLFDVILNFNLIIIFSNMSMNPGIEFIFAIEAAMLLSLNFQCYGKTENCLYKSVALQ